MNIAIIADSYPVALDLCATYGISRAEARIFTTAEKMQGMDFGGWLVITEQANFLIPVGGTKGIEAREAFMRTLS